MQDPNLNLIGQLQDCWAFESRLVALVLDQVSVCADRASRHLYRSHARLTESQRKRLERRLEALGVTPQGQGGWFSARLERLAKEVATMEVWREESVQLLVTSYGIKQLECAMYRALLALAESTNDEATESLARACLEEEEATSRQLLFCIGMATRGRTAA